MSSPFPRPLRVSLRIIHQDPPPLYFFNASPLFFFTYNPGSSFAFGEAPFFFFFLKNLPFAFGGTLPWSGCKGPLLFFFFFFSSHFFLPLAPPIFQVTMDPFYPRHFLFDHWSQPFLNQVLRDPRQTGRSPSFHQAPHSLVGLLSRGIRG